MKNVKMPTTRSYHDFLIESLKNPEEASAYLESHLEGDEYEFDPTLLRLALFNVLEALGQTKLTPEQQKRHAAELETILAQPAELAMFQLGLWLEKLGLKLTVTVAETTEAINNQVTTEAELIT